MNCEICVDFDHYDEKADVCRECVLTSVGYQKAATRIIEAVEGMRLEAPLGTPLDTAMGIVGHNLALDDVIEKIKQIGGRR